MTSERLDRQSFQQILANAFAVQQSQIDQHSLAAFVESQRRIAAGEVGLDGAMNLVVDSARSVANAGGVAIGLLHGDRLVYRAGSGSAAPDVERRVTASLTASSDIVGNREILRVENAAEDTRIQAAICRQLGAQALLILPICHQRHLTGVLEVRFSEPHIFDMTEVRKYWLMAALVEEAVVKELAPRVRENEGKDAARIETKPDLAACPVAAHAAPVTARSIPPRSIPQRKPMFSYG